MSSDSFCPPKSLGKADPRPAAHTEASVQPLESTHWEGVKAKQKHKPYQAPLGSETGAASLCQKTGPAAPSEREPPGSLP